MKIDWLLLEFAAMGAAWGLTVGVLVGRWLKRWEIIRGLDSMLASGDLVAYTRKNRPKA